MLPKLKKLNSTTYEVNYERARVEIGDVDSDKFIPCCKMHSFENETSLKVTYVDRPYSLLNTDSEAEEVDKIILTEVEIYELYIIGKPYLVGDKIDYYGSLFEVIQAHTSQEDWLPTELPALYKTSTPQGIIGAWVQPLGSHDAYALDTKVSHNGKVWITTVQDNVWEPGVYGWTETTGTIDVECYSIDENSFEFEIVLRGKPASNVVEMAIETEGLNFYYQPTLTQEEIDEGAFRPENVIGSYAVYHATCGQMHKGQATAEKYKTGKAFHIYRPKVVDANEDWVWGELNIDGSTLSITISQQWLDNAVYPVKVDPTFGYTTVGATTGSAVRPRGTLFPSPPPTARVVSISWYGSVDLSTDLACAAIYLGTGASVGTSNILLEESEEKNHRGRSGSNDWEHFNLRATYETGSEDGLFLLLQAQSGSYYWDTDLAFLGVRRGLGGYYIPWMPDLAPHGGAEMVTNNDKYSIYATYELDLPGRILAGGATTQKVFAYDPSDMSKVAESLSYGWDIRALAFDGTYIYAAGQTKRTVWKIDPSDMSKVGESLDYGGTIYALTSDGTYIYAAGFTTRTVWKIDPSDMSKVGESLDYGSAIYALTFDGTYIYAAGSITNKVFQYNPADMSKVGESLDYGGTIRVLTSDGTYIYAAGFTTSTVWKIDPSDMSKVAESLSYDNAIYALTFDGTYIYAAGSTTNKVFQYNPADMSKVGESLDYGGTIWALAFKSDILQLSAAQVGADIVLSWQWV